VILASGAFDGLHSGHVAYLQACAAVAHGRPVYVAVAPDAYIRQAKRREPRWSQLDRLATVNALRGVDCVVEQREASVAETIRHLRPDVVVKGVDWAGHLPADVVAACVETGARIVFVDTTRTHGSEVTW
jgi:cytidyltransferase-like protein